MVFRVELTPRAKQDLNRIDRWIDLHAFDRRAVWVDRIEHAIQSLAEFPERCPTVPSLSTGKRSVRQLFCGRHRNVYRIYFAIFGESVRVLHDARLIAQAQYAAGAAVYGAFAEPFERCAIEDEMVLLPERVVRGTG